MRTSAPLNTEVTVTHQAARADIRRKERYMAHIVNFPPLRDGGGHPVYYKDPIPLTDAAAEVNLPVKPASGRAFVSGMPLKPEYTASGGAEVKVPRPSSFLQRIIFHGKDY